MDEPLDLPTRSDCTAIFCRAYGAFLLTNQIVSTVRSVFLYRALSPTLGTASPPNGWIGLLIAGLLSLLLPMMTLLFANLIASEVTGEISFADRRPMQKSDLLPMGVSFVGIFFLLAAFNQTSTWLLGIFTTRGLTPLYPVVVAFSMAQGLLGFFLAFRPRLQRLLHRPT